MERKGAAKRAKLSSTTTKKWEAMDPVVLGLIFAWIPTDVMARTAPLVCRSWEESLIFNEAWSKIDLADWCCRIQRSDFVDELVNHLVFRRCDDLLNYLKAFGLRDDGFQITAAYGKFLTVLKMPMSEVSDLALENSAQFLPPNLNTLDISYCLKITSKGIELLGKRSKRLVKLRRNMLRPDHSGTENIDESEAMAVACTMPGLQHLELSFGLFSDQGLNVIITSCQALGYLDIRGCRNVSLDGELRERCDRIHCFRDPLDAGEGKNDGTYCFIDLVAGEAENDETYRFRDKLDGKGNIYNFGHVTNLKSEETSDTDSE